MHYKDNDRLKALGKFLQYHRLQLKWKQPDLARRTGFGQPWISEVESGKRCPDVFSLLRLAKVLGISPKLLALELEAILIDVKDAPPRPRHRRRPPASPPATPP